MSQVSSQPVITGYKTAVSSNFQSQKAPFDILLDGKPASLRILLPHDFHFTPEYENKQEFVNKEKTIREITKLTTSLIHSYQMTGKFKNSVDTQLNGLKNGNPETDVLVEHTLALINELENSKYTPLDVTTHINWHLKLMTNHLIGKSPNDQIIQELVSQILNPKTEYIDRSKESNNPSFKLVNNGKTFAILKLPKGEFSSSFSGEIKFIDPLLAPVWQNDLLADEQDKLLGFNVIPSTVAIEIEQEGVVKRGTIQQFIPNAFAANQLCYEKNGAQLIKSIPTITAHQLAMASIFFGFAAGHGANYVLQERNGVILYGYIIDGKETFIPINKIAPGTIITCVKDQQEKLALLKTEMKESPSTEKEEEIAKLSKQIETAEKAIIVMRIFILGFQQNNQPLDRATLLNLTNPCLLPMLIKYQERVKNYYQVSPETFQAQLERVNIIQTLFKEELAKEEIDLTSRKTFYKICGGEHLYKIGKERGYPDLTMFAHLISDPYHYAQKDFSNHNSIPHCTRLEKPADDTPEMALYFKNLCEIEGVKQS